MLVLLAWLAAAAPPAEADVPGCELLTAADLAVGFELVEGMARQNQTSDYREVVRTLETDIECVDFEVGSEDLGRLLWHKAAATYPAEGWQGALTTMVRVAPRTERTVDPTSALARWAPGRTPATTPTYRVDDGARVLVDGSVRPRFFELPPDGDHLVQFWQGDALTTLLLPAGETLAGRGPAWRQESVEASRQRRKRARVASTGVAGGLAVVGVTGAVIAAQATHEITESPSSERDRLLKRRTAGHALLGTGAVGALTSLGVGWGVRW